MARALLIDSDAARAGTLVAELERHGYDIATVTAAEEAPAAVQRLEPLLVCIGARVGGEDGLAICRALQQQPGAGDRVVVIVGAPGEVEALSAVEAGAADVWPMRADGGRSLETRVVVAGQFARLQAEHVSVGGEFAVLREALDMTGTGFILTDPRLEDDPVVYANRAFLEMTGYQSHEVLGRNCRFLQGPETSRARVEQIGRRLRARQPVTTELVNYRKDGTPFWNELHISPVHDARGELVRFVGVQVDITLYREQRRLFVREQGARAAAEEAERRSAFLAGAGPLLDASLDLRATLESLTRLSVPYLGDVCLVQEVVHGSVRRLALAAADPAVEALVRDLPSPCPVDPGEPLARVSATGRGEIVAGGAQVFGPASIGGRLEPGSAGAGMIVPLKARGRTIGALALASLRPDRTYGPDDLELAEELARRAALALDNARLYQDLGTIARTLQQGLLPNRLPEVDGLELAARFRPAGDGSVIGGDFYDVLPRRGGLDLVIGDVTGKGARAAGLTALVRHTLRTAARYERSPSGVLAVLNEALIAERAGGGRYCTAAVCRVHVDGDSATATLCCAGHPLPMVVRRGGTVEPIGRPGSVLGWVDDPKLVDVPFRLDRGDSLVLYTDGVTEARTVGAAYGEEGLESLLRAAAGDDAATIAARIDRAAAHAGARRDDVAVLVTRVRRAGSA